MAFQQGTEGVEDNTTASAMAAPAPAVSAFLNHWILSSPHKNHHHFFVPTDN